VLKTGVDDGFDRVTVDIDHDLLFALVVFVDARSRHSGSPDDVGHADVRAIFFVHQLNFNARKRGCPKAAQQL